MFNSKSLTILLFGLFSAVTSFRPMGQQLFSPSTILSDPHSVSSGLYATSKDDDTSDTSDSLSQASTLGTSVRFLGRGTNAIVRPGCVLVAPPDEFHHFLRQAAVFIYAMGEDEYDTFVIRGVIIDHPTPFTIQEMMAREDNKDSSQATFLQNLLYRGGELGDAAFLLHSDATLGEQANLEMIGTSGVFQGGLDHALSTNYSMDPQKAKFFFSYMEFTEAELEEMLENREDESTQWVSVEVPPDFVLSSDWDRGEAWARLRNAIREM